MLWAVVDTCVEVAVEELALPVVAAAVEACELWSTRVAATAPDPAPPAIARAATAASRPRRKRLGGGVAGGGELGADCGSLSTRRGATMTNQLCAALLTDMLWPLSPPPCETAALQQGLAYYGINVGQPQLFAQQNADVRLPAMGSNHSVLRWGNPYKNFVGYVNGSDWIPTGYGVYWPVILDLARNYGLPNAIGGEGFAPSAIYSALAAGQPVQVWVETRFARVALATCTAWDGTAVRYSYAEHSLTLTGVSPTQVRVNDVLDASQYWVSKSLFEANFADFNNMAVIFR